MSERGWRNGESQLQDDLEAFLRDAGVDESAAERLRVEDPGVIRGVLENGIRPGARNPSALLMSLIKKVRDNLQVEAMAPPRPEDDAAASEEVEAFLAQNTGFDETAVEALRAQNPAVIWRVLERGPFDTGRNPSALLMAAIKDAKREVLEERPLPRARDVRRQSVDEFIAAHQLDEETQEELFRLDEEVLRRVLDQGAAITGRNKSSTVMALIRTVQRESAPRELPARLDLETYIQESDIDSVCEEVLRSQSEEMIQTILQEGILRGRNPSALLMARIKRLHSGEESPGAGEGPPASTAASLAGPPVGAPPAPTARARLEAEIRRFAEASGVDEGAEEALRAQSREVVQTILGEGVLEGRNPSALLMARIRQLTRGGGERERRAAAVPAAEATPPWATAASVPPAQRHHRGSLELRTFIDESGLDADAEEVLRAQSDDIIQTILDEGVLRGRNPSALLTARIRQLTSGEGGRGGGRAAGWPGEGAAAAAAAAERALHGCLDELAQTAWDWSASEASFDDALRRVASARRAARAAVARVTEHEPPRKRLRIGEEPSWGAGGGGGRTDWSASDWDQRPASRRLGWGR